LRLIKLLNLVALTDGVKKDLVQSILLESEMKIKMEEYVRVAHTIKLSGIDPLTIVLMNKSTELYKTAFYTSLTYLVRYTGSHKSMPKWNGA